jgi:hypothetical protein
LLAEIESGDAEAPRIVVVVPRLEELERVGPVQVFTTATRLQGEPV